MHDQITALDVGDFEGSLKVRDGENWLALFRTPTGFELRKTRIKLEKTVWEDRSATTVSAEHETTDNWAFVLLSTHRKLFEEGKVETVFDGHKESLKDFPHTFQFLDENYKLEVTGHRYSSAHKSLYCGHAKLVLTAGRRSQVLYDASSEDNLFFKTYLRWAGDLDNDGKLDFLTSDNEFGIAGKGTLYLSSLATEGQIVVPIDYELGITDGC